METLLIIPWNLKLSSYLNSRFVFFADQMMAQPMEKGPWGTRNGQGGNSRGRGISCTPRYEPPTSVLQVHADLPRRIKCPEPPETQQTPVALARRPRKSTNHQTWSTRLTDEGTGQPQIWSLALVCHFKIRAECGRFGPLFRTIKHFYRWLLSVLSVEVRTFSE